MEHPKRRIASDRLGLITKMFGNLVRLMVAKMYAIVNHNGHEIEVLPTASGYFCRWDSGETYTVPTSESSDIFSLETHLIDLPEIYGTPKERDLVS